MPDVKDFERIERIVREVGENELEIGELPEREEEEELGVSPRGKGEGPESDAGEVPGGAEGEEHLTELLKDIEVGLTEEKLLEEKVRKEGKGVFEGLPEDAGADKGGFGLPLDFDMENLDVEEGPAEELLEERGIAEEEKAPGGKPLPREPKGGAAEGKIPPGPLEEFENELGEIEKEAAEKILDENIPEGVREDQGAGAVEEDFVLPDLEEAGDFEKETGDLEIPEAGFPELEESPGLEAGTPQTEEGGGLPPQAPLQETVPAETAPAAGETAEPETTVPDIGVFEFPELDEETPTGGTGFGEGASDAGAPSAKSPLAEKGFGEIETPEVEWPSAESPLEAPPELSVTEPSETIFPEEAVPKYPAFEGAPPPEEELPTEEEAREVEAPSERRTPSGPPAGEADIELTDEDIVLIKTKLKQLAGPVAAKVQEIVMDAALPDESMKGLLNLLIQDAPEEEIVQYVEWATGKKIAPRKRVPIERAVPRPRPFEAITENLGPLVRVAGLFAAILLVLGALIGVFVYKPLQANKYYRLGINQIKAENYRGAEESFRKAVDIREKTREYDNFGWEYMKSGNYDAAEKKFSDGIEREKDKPQRTKTVDLRLHRAQLYNILSRNSEADRDYDEAIKIKPGFYAYESLKGRNLVDWGRSLLEPGKEHPPQFEQAYDLFRKTYAKNKKNSDAIFQMLAIELLKKNDENIHYYHSLLKSRFPQAVNRDVHTNLAAYLIERRELDEVWKTLSSVIRRHPDYPQAYFTLALYYKTIDNREDEEKALNAAIEKEKGRKLQYPWEVQDRRLLSDSYNNIGEIYARTEIPGMYAEAIDFYKRAVQADDTNAKVYFNLGQAYFYGERSFDLARSSYERANALGLDNNDLNYNLGSIYFYGKEFEPALRRWTPLSEMYPDNPNIGFALGTLFLYLKKYQSALGEFLWLSEYYERIIKGLGPIKSYNPYHRILLLNCAAVYNNLGVSYQKLYETTGNREHQKDALVSLYRGGEIADLTGGERGRIQYNIQYIIHPKVIRSDMAIDAGISDNYRYTIH